MWIGDVLYLIKDRIIFPFVYACEKKYHPVNNWCFCMNGWCKVSCCDTCTEKMTEIINDNSVRLIDVFFPFVLPVKEIWPQKILIFMYDLLMFLTFLARICSGNIFYSIWVVDDENLIVIQIILIYLISNGHNEFVCAPC